MNVDEFTTSHPAEKDEHVIAVKSSLHDIIHNMAEVK